MSKYSTFEDNLWASQSPSQNLSNIMQSATEQEVKNIPYTADQPKCCSNKPGGQPCPEREAWRAKFKGCQTSYATQPNMRCEVAPIGDRYYIPDLNRMIYERSLVSGAKWNPYEHMHARQMHAQFLCADMRPGSDPYSRPVKNLKDSFCAQQQKKGPPSYTQF